MRADRLRGLIVAGLAMVGGCGLVGVAKEQAVDTATSSPVDTAPLPSCAGYGGLVDTADPQPCTDIACVDVANGTTSCEDPATVDLSTLRSYQCGMGRLVSVDGPGSVETRHCYGYYGYPCDSGTATSCCYPATYAHGPTCVF